MNNVQYYSQYFYYQSKQLVDIFAGDGRKHSSANDEKFLHQSTGYHLRKAFKHFIAGCFVKIDKDSKQPHWSHAVLRLQMAQKVRE